METMRSVGDNKDDANTVLKAMVRLSDDSGRYFLSNNLFRTRRVHSETTRHMRIQVKIKSEI